MGLAISDGITTSSPSPARKADGFTNGNSHHPIPETSGSHLVNGTSPRPVGSDVALSGNAVGRTSLGSQKTPSMRPTDVSPSPTKQQSSHSPHQTSYSYNSSPFAASTNPTTSFPPASQGSARFSYSPVKQSTSPLQPAYSPPQHFGANAGSVFPPSIAPPAKHEIQRPPSSQNPMSSQGFPPAPALSPSARPQILDPPTKKSPAQQ